MLKFRSMYVDAEAGAPSSTSLNERSEGLLFKMQGRPSDHPGREAPAQLLP